MLTFPFHQLTTSRVSRHLLVALAALLLVPALHAATYVVPPDGWMIDDTRTIVTGTVMQSFPRFTDIGEIETVYVVSVDDVIKGSLASHRLELVQFGGRIGDTWTAESGAPRYEIGKRYLIFTDETNQGDKTTRDLALGRFEFVTSAAGEQLTRGGEEIFGWDFDGNAAVERERFATGFPRLHSGTNRGLKAGGGVLCRWCRSSGAGPGIKHPAAAGESPSLPICGYDFRMHVTWASRRWTDDSASDRQLLGFGYAAPAPMCWICTMQKTRSSRTILTV